ncbi:MAG: epoxyqueuosine reductase QueH [Thermodesulfobacteriaceae bacterium]|nr:epoxyqueuosine reductase QueH [Thermodesulfobacteriaceae bacterium]MCX8041857.1 epoxyqueuosine reductase QueH [Thermodesulfobacteriaceae bacterium]MDW8135656.1 epoxyqueuosine reductase QueH [Thermodesulfobacterium sp.]
MILMHLCCGPCSLYPIKVLRARRISFKGFFYNPNLHPYREFRERIKALETVQKIKELEIIWDKGYGLRDFLEKTFEFKDKPEKRCEICYTWRLKATVKKALEIKAEAFTTTLLYSIYQKHELIKEIAEDLSNHYKIPFFYEDFRKGFKEGLEEAKKLGLYLQGYCGCIFSEEERYYKKLK